MSQNQKKYKLTKEYPGSPIDYLYKEFKKLNNEKTN